MSGYIGDASADAQSNAMDVVNNAIAVARQSIVYGTISSYHCQECGEEIPEGRRQAMIGVKYCVQCQQEYHSDSVRIKLLTRML